MSAPAHRRHRLANSRLRAQILALREILRALTTWLLACGEPRGEAPCIDVSGALAAHLAHTDVEEPGQSAAAGTVYSCWLELLGDTMTDALGGVVHELAGEARVTSAVAVYRRWVAHADRAWRARARTPRFAQLLADLIDETIGNADRRGSVAAARTLGRRPPAPALPVPGVRLRVDADALRTELAALEESVDRACRTLDTLEQSSVGSVERRVVARFSGMTLSRLRPRGTKPRGTPLLIVYALVNTDALVDLDARRSLVGGLLARGVDVYLLGWGRTPPRDTRLDLGHYVLDGIGQAVEWLRTHRRRRGVDLLGICQGGTLALTYAALRPMRVRHLVLLATPVDFHARDFMLAQWLRRVKVGAVVERIGNIPGGWIPWWFVGLQPLRLGSEKYLDMLERLADPSEAAAFVRLERWLQDSPDLAGAPFRAFVTDLIQDNALLAGQLAIRGERVELSNIRSSVLNVCATRDRIVPPPASTALRAALDPRRGYREGFIESGHIGMFASPGALASTVGLVSDWLGSRGGRSAAHMLS